MKRHVALIIETSSAYGREILSGIVRFMRMHDEWSVFFEQRDLWKLPPAWLRNWRGDGIISRATTPRLLEAIRDTGVPIVDVTDRWGDLGIPHVRSDDRAIGKMGAEHLLERGFVRFGFCGFKGEAWSKRREEGFIEAVRQKENTSCKTYLSPWHGPSAKAWEVEQASITEWLKQFQPPFALMACNDVRGQHILDACSHLQFAVPEQVSVLGVDNDELHCRICTPPLSSVIPNAKVVGFRAAEMLSCLMNGEPVEEEDGFIQPLGVATRQSTDVVAIDDREIATALHYIRQNATKGLSVDDVVQNTSISRSTLERQVRKYLGRTPQEEIRFVQIKRVRELLLSTDLSTEKIAVLCGFEHPEYLHVVFKRVMGQTPGEFRKQAKP